MEPDAFETQVVEPREYTVAGNKVLVEQDIKVRGAGSGIELEIHSWNVWSFDEEGSPLGCRPFWNTREPRLAKPPGCRSRAMSQGELGS